MLKEESTQQKMTLEELVNHAKKINQNNFPSKKEKRLTIEEALEINTSEIDIIQLKIITKAVQKLIDYYQKKEIKLSPEIYYWAYKANNTGYERCSDETINLQINYNRKNVMMNHFLAREGKAALIIIRNYIDSYSDIKKVSFEEKKKIIDLGMELLNVFEKSSELSQKIGTIKEKKYAISKYLERAETVKTISYMLNIENKNEKKIIIEINKTNLKLLKKTLNISKDNDKYEMGRIYAYLFETAYSLSCFQSEKLELKMHYLKEAHEYFINYKRSNYIAKNDKKLKNLEKMIKSRKNKNY